MLRNDKESDYEKQRRRRIEENQEMLRKLFPEGARKEFGLNSPQPRRSPPKQKKRRQTLDFPLRRNPERKSRSYKSAYDEDEEIEAVVYTPNTLVVKWRGPLTEKSFSSKHAPSSDDSFVSDYSGSDSEGEYTRRAKRRRSQPPAAKPLVDITEEDLVLVAERVADKSYDSVNGTSCHQCRQKTNDLKTFCKSGECVGIRGQFCGPCLRNRYGEDAKAAIMNPTWACPPCRGICNCSFCMKKRGKRCTGILIHLARESGYEDVKTFLGD